MKMKIYEQGVARKTDASDCDVMRIISALLEIKSVEFKVEN